MGSSDTEANALAVMPCTSPSRSTVTIVTPVAKHPIARRNSAGFNPIVVDIACNVSLTLVRAAGGKTLPSNVSAQGPTLPRPGVVSFDASDADRNYAVNARAALGLRLSARRHPPRHLPLAPGRPAADLLPRRRSPRTSRRRPRRHPALQVRRHHLLAQGLSAADQSLPRLLRILHFPPRSGRSRCAHDDAGGSPGGRPRRRKTGMHRSPIFSRRQARTTFS